MWASTRKGDSLSSRKEAAINCSLEMAGTPGVVHFCVLMKSSEGEASLSVRPHVPAWTARGLQEMLADQGSRWVCG